MTTLITGCAGFVGLALAEDLLSSGNDVIGFDLSAPPDRALKTFSSLPGKFDFVIGDIRDRAALDHAFVGRDVDAMVSLAAITADAARERSQPHVVYEVNAASVFSAVETAARHKVCRIVHLSSGAVYGRSGYGTTSLDEATTIPDPEGLYGMSKLAAEQGLARLMQVYGVDLVIGRLGTCYGPWEHDTGARDTLSAPLQILQIAQRGGVATISRDSLRDWLYVRDAAAGIRALMFCAGLPRTIYNVAAGFEFPLSAWCTRLEGMFPGFRWHVNSDDTPTNVNLYGPQDRASMNIMALLNDTDFRPKFDINAAFDDYMSWIKQ
ncbi:hypothetical protein U875_05225 [Pandoraea pnomenusa 3kgm]|uniref:NAD-dependent epimerase/dehydratase family protein n=1 Tax=Pandoraea TaxID=93217 RepID=UPI0003C75A2D|nr:MULTISPECIES: NAD(P)-dependent oxidoreductase [Pandoraea]AHB08279.1 hypothetical protein U875_05225 [Pandoraea pnomenusa 3kgm]AHN76899.1 hypothetical protein DA70_22295 [Pandoraea pnomenusa]